MASPASTPRARRAPSARERGRASTERACSCRRRRTSLTMANSSWLLPFISTARQAAGERGPGGNRLANQRRPEDRPSFANMPHRPVARRDRGMVFTCNIAQSRHTAGTTTGGNLRSGPSRTTMARTSLPNGAAWAGAAAPWTSAAAPRAPDGPGLSVRPLAPCDDVSRLDGRSYHRARSHRRVKALVVHAARRRIATSLAFW